MHLDTNKTIFLIDGSSFLYRAYHAVKPMHTKAGEPIQAVFVFCRMIEKLIKTCKPAHMVLCWDSKGKTTRHSLYSDYKATRQAPPNDLFEQKKRIMEFASLIGLKQLAQEGVEADDLMYSIAREQSLKDYMVVFITSDKDMYQAISDHVIIFDPFKDAYVAQKDVEAQFGFPIGRLILYYGLLGDASDNIPGVVGIGKKTAQELCKQFSSMEDLYSHIEHSDLTDRVRRLLQADKDNAFLSRDLFLLQYVPLNSVKDEFVFDATGFHNADPLFKELDFKSLLPSHAKASSNAVDLQARLDGLGKHSFITISNAEQLKALCDQLEKVKIFSIDTETVGILRPLQMDIIGISVCMQEGTAYYIPFGHETDQEQLTAEQALQALKPILENALYKKYVHHAKFDQTVLCKVGIQLRGLVCDTLIAAHLLSKEWQKIGLKALSERYFEEFVPSYDQIVKDNNYKDFSQVPLGLATTYAACDAHQTWRLAQIFIPQIAQQSMDILFNTIELPLVEVLVSMEMRGIILDTAILRELGDKVQDELVHLSQEVKSFWSSQEPFNLNSPRQIQILLFDMLKLPMQRKSHKGGSSTDAAVLGELAKLHPVASLILRYRELFKLKSTYIDSLPGYINPQTGRIHTNYNQTLVATGRLSSSDPNLQNIPADTVGYGIEVRAAFKPEPGHLFLSADYSQIELRVLAHLSQDENLMNAFLHNVDIHAQTAAYIFDLEIGQVSHAQRQLGKRINFSILYGLTPYGLSKDLDISVQDAKRCIEKYFAQFPKVRAWMDGVIEQTLQFGYVTTLWGRRRYLPGIYEKNKTLYEQACRVAINTKAQGTAAELMKKGMINLYAALKHDVQNSYIVLQIHDELIVSVPKNEIQKAEDITKAILENVAEWSVPLVVSMRSGADWKEVTK